MRATPLSRLGRNSLWLLVARVGTQGLAVLFTILLARQLGGAGFGEFAFLTAIMMIGNILTTFGTDMLLIREIAGAGDFSQLPAALLLQLLLSVPYMLLVWLAAPLLPQLRPPAQLALQVYSLALIPMAFFSVFSAALRGHQSMGAYTLLNLVFSVLQLLAVWEFAQGPNELAVLVLLLICAQVLAALLSMLLCARQIDGFWRSWHFSGRALRDVTLAGAPLGWLGLLGMIYQKLGLGLVSSLGGAALAGWFSAGQKAVEAAKTGHQAAFSALYPALAEAGASSGPGWSRAMRYSWWFLLAAAVLAAAGLSVFAAPLVQLAYGSEYEAAVPVLRILAWVLVPYTVNNFLTLSFVVAKKERVIGWVLAVSLLGLGLLSVWWIPVAGAVGAAWAALGAECLQAVLLLMQRSSLSFSSSVQGKSHELSPLP